MSRMASGSKDEETSAPAPLLRQTSDSVGMDLEGRRAPLYPQGRQE